MIIIEGKYSKATVMIDSIDPTCEAQIHKFVNHPAFTNDSVIMPDCHAGIASVVGFTTELNPEKVIPNVIGVDENCGMLSFIMYTKLPPMEKIDSEIRNRIPFGTSIRNTPAIQLRSLDLLWRKTTDQAHRFADAYRARFGESIAQHIPDYSPGWLEQKCKAIGMDPSYAYRSIGTLGSGNHFIELGHSQKGYYMFTVHSGSRNLGKRMCEYWQDKALSELRHIKTDVLNEEIRKLRDSARSPEEKRNIQTRIRQIREQYGINDKATDELAHLKQPDSAGYLFDLIFAQQYARINRETMMNDILKSIGFIGEFTADYGEIVESVHNYIDFGDFIIRKGAIKSYTGVKMVIPLNMADGILLCEGKSNNQWNCSAPHGAGRVLSRSQAKLLYEDKPEKTMADFTEKMAGVFSTSVCPATIDESPMAYKDAAVIRAAIQPTATVLDSIRPIMNLKDKSEGKGTKRKKT